MAGDHACGGGAEQSRPGNLGEPPPSILWIRPVSLKQSHLPGLGHDSYHSVAKNIVISEPAPSEQAKSQEAQKDAEEARRGREVEEMLVAMHFVYPSEGSKDKKWRR